MRTTYSMTIVLVGACFLILYGIAMATDAPHTGVGYENVQCTSCHLLHNALGPSLTNNASNPNLCMSCHVTGGSATNWPFSSSDQATPGTSGTSHRWDRDMTPGVAPLNLAAANANNKYGLRTPAELTLPTLKSYVNTFTNVVSCSVCHDEHSQDYTPYDPFSSNASNGDGGGTATGGSLNTLSDTSKTSWTANQWATYTVVITGSANASNIGVERTISSSTGAPDYALTVSSIFPVAIQAGDTYYITKLGSSYDYGTATGGSTTSVVATKTWTGNAWAGYYVKMTSGANAGLRRRIESNTSTTLTIPSGEAFPNPVANGDKFYIMATRHFMRINNALNDICVDCHYYRASSTATDVRTYDGNKKSHPVGKKLSDASDTTQFNAAFLEPQAAAWAPQSGTRGQLNGGTDTNLTNNITVGMDGKITCLSCHNIHYSDSNSATVDTPSGYSP